MTKHTKLNLIIVLAAVVLFSVTALSACNPPPQYEGIPVIFSLEGGTYQNGEGQAVVYYDFPEGARRLIKPLQETAEKDDPPVRAGYVFEGWFKTKNNDGSVSEPWDFDNDEIGEEGVTLYAGWSHAIKYTYEVYDYDTDELVATRTVNAGVRFRETYATRSGYTLLALYDGDRQPWDEDFVHPGGETDTAVKVYARYIKGDYEVVRTAEELAIAAVSNENIYVAADIDMEGEQLSFGNFTEREFLGNGYNTDYVFNGYFTNSECTAAIATPYITAESVTLYAKYSNPAVLTIVFKDGVTSNATVRYSVGDVATVEIPVYAGYAFVGWYTTEDYQQGTEWTSGSVITTDTTIYAKWETAPIFNHHHYGLFYLGDREDDNDNPYGNNGADHRQGEFTFDPYGAYQVISSSGPWPFNNNPAQINDFNPEAGTMTITYGYSGGDTGEAYIDMETGFIVLNYMDVGADLDRMFLLVPGFTANAEYSNFADSFWNAGKTRTIAFTITEEDGTQKNYSLFIHENQVYFNVSFKTAETGGTDISADACYNSTLLYVLADDGSLIAKFAYDGNTMVEMDGSEGTYTNADGEDPIVLNGAGYVTIGENTYVITKVDGEEGPDGTYGVYTDTEYLEYTIDVEAKTYTVNKPMVHVTYNAGSYATVPAADVNKNFGIVLPVPECDTHIFRYWCTDADLNNPVELVDGKYIPTGDVTLFAKWDVRVNLTLDLGDGVTQVHGYGAGDALDISQYDPSHTNEKIFGGWYKDSTFSEEFTDETITDDITVYAKWIDAGTCTVTGDSPYAFVYDAESGWWKNNNQGVHDSSASVVIEAVGGPIIVKVTYWISSEANWDYLSSSVYGTVEGDPINTKGSNYTEEQAQTAEFLLQAGSTLTLTYSKDGSGSRENDTAYLQIVVNGTAVTDYVPAA